jgi:probable rRNA maturation factor
MMILHLTNFQRRYPLPEPAWHALFVALSHSFSSSKDLSVVLMNDRRIREYNQAYLQHDYATDVLAFPLEDDYDTLEGEIFISTETAQREAQERGIPLEEEVIRYFIHGFLHLKGYRDKKKGERDKMFQLQEQWVHSYFHGYPEKIRKKRPKPKT